MDYFRETFEGLKQTADGLIVANRGMEQATQGIKRAIEAAFEARGEQEDLRETVQRLESLVMDLTREVRQLRDDRGRA